jgi:hypothetical protein
VTCCCGQDRTCLVPTSANAMPMPALVAPRHRLHVVPWLRRLRWLILLPNWLAITLRSDIFSWRPLDDVELAHELEHVRQWDRYGLPFAVRYLRASLRSWLRGEGWYRGNPFEVAAVAAAGRERLRLAELEEIRPTPS